MLLPQRGVSRRCLALSVSCLSHTPLSLPAGVSARGSSSLYVLSTNRFAAALFTVRSASTRASPPPSASTAEDGSATPPGMASTAAQTSPSTSHDSGDGLTVAPNQVLDQQQQSRSTASRTSRRHTPTSATDSTSLGKSKHGPRSAGGALKVKKKAPWGVHQLRDSWSEDAMSKSDRENMDERIHREYRYHPDEFRRHWIRYTAFLTIPCVLFGTSITYYYETGRPIWTADPQHLLNMIRVMDTSPRSKLYAHRLEETYELPPHVVAYRQQHAGQRAYDERVFRVTHSAFERPNEDALRRLELEEELKKQAEVERREAELADDDGAAPAKA